MVPRIGVISGATIIEPITVAVESETTPALAMIDARINRIQNRLSFRLTSGPSKKTAPRMWSRSFSAMLGMIGALRDQ